MQKHKANKQVIYGKHPVLSAITNSQRKIYRFFTTEKYDFDKYSKSISSQLLSNSEISKLLPEGAVHGGYALECSLPKTYSVNEFVEELNSEICTIVALDQVTDPHNIGAIIRSAVAFNVNAILITESNSNYESPIVAKSASGALESIKIIEEINLSRSLNFLKDKGFWCIGLDGEAKKDLTDLPKFEKKVILLGAEGKGLRRLSKENCDELAKISINSNIESLNVSNAAAITFYELNKNSN
ncbi:MAG: 23S rRNA (guanosine(2251)-2'-O)-methyltransferase RlmB [Sphingobacteriia bacterium]|nr:23S rRNA (guanosine(2251)-2'-O)-methyltransferase RlmB [Sphingobacteriia bacterium]